MSVETTATTVYVSILDKEYQIACPEGEQDALKSSARMLDQRMRTIRSSGNVIGTERIAVMAALNLCHELLVSQDENGKRDGSTSASLASLNERLAMALDRLEDS